MLIPPPRKGMPDTELDEEKFKSRFRELFEDPSFDALRPELSKAAETAWKNYSQHRKAPTTVKAGAGYVDPDYDLSVDWRRAQEAVTKAQIQHTDRSLPSRVLLINGSPRNEHTCPGEMSKTFRLVEEAKRVMEGERVCVDVLDLSRTTGEYGRHIHPCKGCFSTSPALCHWPCSCYPNHGLGQTQDWMNEIYPLWVAAHGIFIISPCHWYQAPTVLKAMIDRLVCADGGNTDPSSTHGKDATAAKALELKGWGYPKHLAERVFALIVHGDSEGADILRRSLHDWLSDMNLRPAGARASIDRYIGYYRPYATSHEDLDKDQALFEETRNAARMLTEAVGRMRDGDREPGISLKEPRSK